MPASYILLIAVVFIFGSLVGSFLNVLVDRPQSRRSPLKGRSECDFCSHKLSWLDLIPLASFVALGGKCRYCHRKLSLYYPVVELVTAALFVIVFFLQGFNIFNPDLTGSNFQAIIYYFLIVSVLIVIFFTDLKYGIIPFSAVIIGIVATVMWHSYFPTQDISIWNYIYSGIGAFVFFLLLFLGTKGRGIGFGDVVFVLLMGFMLGFPNIILGFYIAFLSGAIISVILVLAKKKKMRGSTIPFGPFLVSGTIISLFWGKFLVDTFMQYILR